MLPRHYFKQLLIGFFLNEKVYFEVNESTVG